MFLARSLHGVRLLEQRTLHWVAIQVQQQYCSLEQAQQLCAETHGLYKCRIGSDVLRQDVLNSLSEFLLGVGLHLHGGAQLLDMVLVDGGGAGHLCCKCYIKFSHFNHSNHTCRPPGIGVFLSITAIYNQAGP